MASETDALDTSIGKPLVAADQNGQNASRGFCGSMECSYLIHERS